MKAKRSRKMLWLAGAGLALLAVAVVLFGRPSQGAPVATVYKSPT